MNSPNFVFGSALAVIGLGYLLKSWGFIKISDGKSVTRLLMYSTFPALVFTTMIQVEISAELLWMPLICVVFGCLCSFLGFQLFKNEENPADRGILTMGCAGYNLGLFAFPLIEGIWGMKGLLYAAMFDLGNSVINFIVTYGVGNYLSNQPKKGNIAQHIFKKVFSLPPFLAMLIGLSINLLHIPVPLFISEVIGVVAKGNKPLVLLLMGIYFSIRLPKSAYFKVFKVLGFRYALGLTAGFILYYLVPFDQHYRNMLLICIILPAGMTLITYSDELEFNTSIAAALVNFSMLISFSLMWILVNAFHMAN
ncbi:AEC family transporter [Aquirufa sp. ROCK2-A2]